MKIRPISLIPIFLLLLMAYMIIESFRFGRLEATLLPLVFGSAIFILAALQLTRELRSKEVKAGTEPTPRVETKSSLRQLGLGLSWLVGFFLGVYVLGFLIVTMLFVLAYLKVHGRGWLKAICAAALVTASIYGIFEIGFRFHLYRGLIFS